MKLLPILFVVILTLPLCASCANIGLFEPRVSGLVTCNALKSDYGPQDNINAFYLDSPQICCSARLEGIYQKVTVKARWMYVRGDRATLEKPLVQEQKAECGSDCNVGFTLAPPASGFIGGEYKVVLTIDDREKAGMTFLIHKDTSVNLPDISTFSANPLRITAGQPAALAWKVNGATRVTIEPSPGPVSSTGSVVVSPTSDTTYTLYALNRGGVSLSSLAVRVSQPVTNKPDLVITEFWNSGNVLSFRIRNNGIAPSCPSQAYLYKNDIKEAEDYIAPLNPGEERVEQFLTYHFSPRFNSILGGAIQEGTTDAVNIRLCANGDHACPETDTANNCLEHNFGPLLNLDLLRFVTTGAWQSNAGDLKWPTLKDSKDGFVGLATAQMEAGAGQPNALLLCPPQMADAWIQGRIGLPRGFPVKSSPVAIPHKCKFKARVSLTYDTPAGVNVKFILGMIKGGEISYFAPVTISTRGKSEPYEADLSKLAGQEVEFVLRAEASAPLQQGCAAWIEPTIIQER